MASPGVPWWQVVGGLFVVFALLILFMKLLARLPQAGGNPRAGVLAVWQVGPRREVQVLRLQDEVHYLYRQDGAMVLLRTEPLAAWQGERATGAPVGPVDPWRRLWDLLRGIRLHRLAPHR